MTSIHHCKINLFKPDALCWGSAVISASGMKSAGSYRFYNDLLKPLAPSF